MGVGLVVDVLARTEVAEDFGAAMAAKLWLLQIESAVTKAELDLLRRQSTTPEDAASPAFTGLTAAKQLPTPSETAQADPFVVPTPAASSTRPPFGSCNNPSGWKSTSTAPNTSAAATSSKARAKSPVFEQQDQLIDDPWKSDDFGPSASGAEDSQEHSRSRSGWQAPPREDTPPKVAKEATPAPRARASASASASKRDAPVRLTRVQSLKYTLTIDSASSELEEATESEEDGDDDEDDGEEDDDYDDDLSYRSDPDGQADGATAATRSSKGEGRGRAGLSTGAATPAVAAAPTSPAKRAAPAPTPSAGHPAQRLRLAAPVVANQPAAAPQSSTQATLLASVFRPVALPSLSPPASLVAYSTLDRVFSRPQIGGPQVAMVSKGWTEQQPQYRSSANFLALDPTLNFYGKTKNDY